MKRISVCFLLVFAAALAAAPKGTVNADKVNLRLGPGLTHPVVGSLTNGQSVKINKVIGSWLELAVPETLTAYVNEARINPDDTLNGELNMRTRMSTTAPILGVLPKGTKVKRLDKRANGWVQILYKGDVGYVNGDYVEDYREVTNTANATAVVSEPPRPRVVISRWLFTP